MGKNKLQRFAEMATYKHVIQPTLQEVLNKDYSLKGNWNSQFFGNNNPIVLELGCGKGEYTVGLSKRFPDKNFIGIDIKGARIWRGAKTAVEENLTNVGFLRTRIEHILSFFAPNEISEIWITFPDPQEKRIRAKKRLTSSRFLPMYQQFLKTDGIIHLKTDNQILYDYTYRLCLHNEIDIIKSTSNLYETETDVNLLSIQTFYESQYLAKGVPIKYIQFTLHGKTSFQEPPEED
ncbi:MAG TPA: tRNA (guanosine(46)-N7)-methyltransferase TrmB [Bacteroidales bacterium]|nr:tRNA (guanosine(46)-N7)-methyltransferase TrmB [Bacteroidales bacterium]